MKILIFSQVYYPDFIGGAEIAVKEITDRISPKDIEFDMISLRLDSRLPRYEKIGNINIHRIGWVGQNVKNDGSMPWYISLNKYAYVVTAVIKAIELHKINNYDAIWSIMASYSSFAATIFKVIKSKVKFILTLQDGDPIPYIKRRALPLYPIFKMFFTKADCIQCISQYLSDWARDMKAKCPIIVIPNAVDSELFAARKPYVDQEVLRQRLGLKDGDVVLVTTSRLVKKNAVGDIIDSLTYLPSNFKLIIIGHGQEESMLLQKTEELKLKNRVIFLGHIAHSDIPQYLHISHIFIRPSISEGFGNSYIEAMAASLPVIATPVGGIVDFLKDGETGLFCDVKNPKSIALKVEKLIKDQESREYIVKNALNLVNEKYQWDIVASDMKNKVFLRVL